MARIESIEANRLARQGDLDALKTAGERNKLGQFATPPDLASAIVTHVLQLRGTSDRISFFDPAVGTGSFYSALRRACRRKDIRKALGIEIDPVVAETATTLWTKAGLDVVTGDFTNTVPPCRGRFDLILTNPPYVRHHHIGSTNKPRLQQQVRERLGLEISGLAGLYAYFLLLAHDWLSDRGFAAWLIPSEFMDVNYGAAVRKYLTDRVKLIKIHRFAPSDIQFCDALVSSAIVIYQKIPSPEGYEAQFSYGGSISHPERQQLISTEDLRSSSKWTHYPTQGKRENGRPRATLSDLFTVRRGIATGANKFFILRRADAESNGIPDDFLKPILPSPRYLNTAVIEDFGDGYPDITDQRALIDCSMREEDIKSQYPAFWSYLADGFKQHVQKGYLTSRRTPWYSQEQRSPAPFLCTYMGRSQNGGSPFRFIWNKSKAIAPNVYLMLYPKSPLTEALAADPCLHAVVFDILKTIGRSDFLEQGRVYGGALHKIEPKELGRISADAILMALDGVRLSRQMALAFA